MAKFLVDLKLQIGEYEKSNVHLIEAETLEQAMLQAMAGESHGNANMDTNDGTWWDMGGEMAYCVNRCSKISDEIAGVLVNTHCFYVNGYCPEEIIDMLDEDAEIRDIELLLKQLQ